VVGWRAGSRASKMPVRKSTNIWSDVGPASRDRFGRYAVSIAGEENLRANAI
jgi:hypothetical protein